MEQSLAPLTNASAINASSMTASISTNDSASEQPNSDDNSSSVVVVVPPNDVMDLLRAIEMSRLQAVRENEQNIYRPNQMNPTSNPNDKINYFNDLQQTIELSLQTKNEQSAGTTSKFPFSAVNNSYCFRVFFSM